MPLAFHWFPLPYNIMVSEIQKLNIKLGKPVVKETRIKAPVLMAPAVSSPRSQALKPSSPEASEVTI